MALWGIAFLLLLSAPLALFGVWAVKGRRWRLRRLAPYNAVYCGGVGLLLGRIVKLGGWDLVAATLIVAALALVSTLEWARAVDTRSGHD